MESDRSARGATMGSAAAAEVDSTPKAETDAGIRPRLLLVNDSHTGTNVGAGVKVVRDSERVDARLVDARLADASLLLPRIAAGDDGAVRECVNRYGALVWSLARRWAVDDPDAEDAVQEIFIALWRSAARFDATRASEPGWVAMVARRRLIDRSRQRQRSPVFEFFQAGFDMEDETEPDQDVELDTASRAGLARAALLTLPDAQRRMLELSLLDGKTHDEIARETSVPLGTVKSHIRRGLTRMRALLMPAHSLPSLPSLPEARQ